MPIVQRQVTHINSANGHLQWAQAHKHHILLAQYGTSFGYLGIAPFIFNEFYCV